MATSFTIRGISDYSPSFHIGSWARLAELLDLDVLGGSIRGRELEVRARRLMDPRLRLSATDIVRVASIIEVAEHAGDIGLVYYG